MRILGSSIERQLGVVDEMGSSMMMISSRTQYSQYIFRLRNIQTTVARKLVKYRELATKYSLSTKLTKQKKVFQTVLFRAQHVYVFILDYYIIRGASREFLKGGGHKLWLIMPS